MGTDIKEGEHEIEFYYDENNDFWMQLKEIVGRIILLLFIGLLIEIMFQKWKNYSVFKNR